MNVSKDVLALKFDIIVHKNRDECLKWRFRKNVKFHPWCEPWILSSFLTAHRQATCIQVFVSLSFIFFELPVPGRGGIVRRDLHCLLMQSWRDPEEMDNPNIQTEVASSGQLIAQWPGFPHLWQSPFLVGFSVPNACDWINVSTSAQEIP